MISLDTEKILKKAMKVGFIKTNDDLFTKPVIDIQFSGTTCISVIVRGNLVM
jgi:hypothetical protein